MARIDQVPRAPSAVDAVGEVAAVAVPTPAERRRRATWITILTVGIISASALVAVPAIADANRPETSDRVVVCTSGVVDEGDIQTSSAVATRVPDGDTAVPEGCEER